MVIKGIHSASGAVPRRRRWLVGLLFFCLLGPGSTSCVFFYDTDVPRPPDASGDRGDADDLGPGDADGASTDSDATTCDSVVPFEVCNDCVDNDCDGSIDEVDCRQARLLTVETGAADAPPGYSVAVAIDHQSLVAVGDSRADGADVRLWFAADGGAVEIDRVLDPESSWNEDGTVLWFALREGLAATRSDARYLLEFGPDAVADLDDEQAVFRFADFFGRPDSEDPGNAWEVVAGDGDVDLLDQALAFTELGNANNRPLADHAFDPLTDDFVWRFGFDWARTGSESSYRLHMQLGDSTQMDIPPSTAPGFSNAGVGPSLLWASPSQGMDTPDGFGYEVDETATQIAVADGEVDVEVRVRPATGRYDVRLDGAALASDVAFTSAQSRFDRIRFMCWQMSDASFGSTRQFDYVIVRRLIDPEPTVSVSPLPSSCP